MNKLYIFQQHQQQQQRLESEIKFYFILCINEGRKKNWNLLQALVKHNVFDSWSRWQSCRTYQAKIKVHNAMVCACVWLNDRFVLLCVGFFFPQKFWVIKCEAFRLKNLWLFVFWKFNCLNWTKIFSLDVTWKWMVLNFISMWLAVYFVRKRKRTHQNNSKAVSSLLIGIMSIR